MGSSPFVDPEMQEIFEGYLIETGELLDSLSQDLMILENDPENHDLLNQIFRSFHTIKGTSSFMGFDKIVEITHHAEDLLNKLRRDELKVNLDIIDVQLEVHDWIELLVNNIKEENDEEVDYSNTIEKLVVLKEGKPIAKDEEHAPGSEEQARDREDEPSEEPKDSAEAGSEAKNDNALEQVLSNSEMVVKPGDFSEDELALIDAAFAEVNDSFKEQSAGEPEATKETPPEKPKEEQKEKNGEEAPKKSETKKETAASGSGPKVAAKKTGSQSGGPAAQKGKSPSAKHASETIRVDMTRVETLMDLSGELVLARNRLAQITENLENEFGGKEAVRDLLENTASVDFVTSEIQSAVMRMRMVPVGKLYQKAPRIVRDLSREFGKKINLVVKGEETEIDRGIIEELNDPLVHMIRNSCDHGIEPPEDRVKTGKPETGTITLDADQEGNAIVLKIGDDGKGMDPDKLKAKAVDKGIITEEQAAQLTKRDALQLIFRPGFSTAVKVSSVSGRGVGMDVVRTNIQKLKGLIEIESEVGQGSTFVIKLPLTLAIIQGLLVRVHEETFAVPLSSVVEVVAINEENVYKMNRQEVIRIREDVMPLLRLDTVLKTRKIEKELKNRNVVVVGYAHRRVGFVCDELLGQQEIVIKSLGEYLGKIRGVAGSTILGDGRVIMIIDVAELIESVKDARLENAV